MTQLSSLSDPELQKWLARKKYGKRLERALSRNITTSLTIPIGWHWVTFMYVGLLFILIMLQCMFFSLFLYVHAYDANKPLFLVCWCLFDMGRITFSRKRSHYRQTSCKYLFLSWLQSITMVVCDIISDIISNLQNLPFKRIKHIITEQDFQPTIDSCILIMVFGQLQVRW